MLFLFDELEADIRIFISRGEISFCILDERGVRWMSGGVIQFSQRLRIHWLNTMFQVKLSFIATFDRDNAQFISSARVSYKLICIAMLD